MANRSFLPTKKANSSRAVVWKETPLWIASAGGCEETVRLLLDRGASVSEMGVGEITPLQIAAEEGHKRVVELLLAAGADKDLRGDNSESPEPENEGPRLLLGYEDGSQTSLSLPSLLREVKAPAAKSRTKEDPWPVRLPEILTKEPLPIWTKFIAAGSKKQREGDEEQEVSIGKGEGANDKVGIVIP
jgi:Ankyrin repeats (3 copies)